MKSFKEFIFEEENVDVDTGESSRKALMNMIVSQFQRLARDPDNKATLMLVAALQMLSTDTSPQGLSNARRLVQIGLQINKPKHGKGKK